MSGHLCPKDEGNLLLLRVDNSNLTLVIPNYEYVWALSEPATVFFCQSLRLLRACKYTCDCNNASQLRKIASIRAKNRKLTPIESPTFVCNVKIIWHSLSEFSLPLLYSIRSGEQLVKPWPNGAPNSSQREPSYKIKTSVRVVLGGQTVENLAWVGRKFEPDQIQANSSQLKPSDKRYITPSKL